MDIMCLSCGLAASCTSQAALCIICSKLIPILGNWGGGCQILTGIGFGISVQITLISVQEVTPSEDMPTACSWEVFFKSLGGAVGISVAQTIFSDALLSRLEQIPGLDAAAVVDAGATDVSGTKGVVPVALVGKVKLAYDDTISSNCGNGSGRHSNVGYGGASNREGGVQGSTPESAEAHVGTPTPK